MNSICMAVPTMRSLKDLPAGVSVRHPPVQKEIQYRMLSLYIGSHCNVLIILTRLYNSN